MLVQYYLYYLNRWVYMYVKIYLFIWYTEWEQGSTQGWGDRGRDRILKKTLHWVQSLTCDSVPGPEIMNWAEIRSQPLTRLRHPGASVYIYIKINTWEWKQCLLPDANIHRLLNFPWMLSIHFFMRKRKHYFN